MLPQLQDVTDRGQLHLSFPTARLSASVLANDGAKTVGAPILLKIAEEKANESRL